MRTATHYGGVAQAFHWITAIVVLVAFIYGPGGSEQRVYSHAKDFDRQLHETLGLVVFTLTALRLLWRVAHGAPEPPALARWMGRAPRLVEGALYGLLVALPATPITGAWLEAHPLTLLAGVEIGPFLPESHATGKTIANLHTWLGDAIMWLAGLHALAGLLHHFVLRDEVLQAMLPAGWRLPRGPAAR